MHAAHQQAYGGPIDPDEALWDKARSQLAEELGVSPGDIVADVDRHYVEQHAPAYAAMMIAEDEELEAMHCAAAEAAQDALADMLPIADGPMHEIVARMASVVVHSILRDRVAMEARS